MRQISSTLSLDESRIGVHGGEEVKVGLPLDKFLEGF
jgi:hypothetical protein